MEMLTVQRPALRQGDMERAFQLQTPEPAPLGARLARRARQACAVSAGCVGGALYRTLPCIDVIRNYKLSNLASDVVAGLSVGVIHIPQSMGFSLLTSLPPVYGLYSTFFPIVLYFIFGMSPHQSFGTMALISLMIGAAADNEVALQQELLAAGQPTTVTTATPLDVNMTAVEGGLSLAEQVDIKLQVAVTITFMAGVIQLGLALLRLGVVARVMSVAFVSALTTAAAAHICTSQIPFVFGIGIPKYTSTFQLPLKWIAVFRNLPRTNVASLVIALVVVLVLVVLKFVINERFKKKLPVPIPGELLVVAIATLVSYLGDFHGRWDVRVVGTIPSGIPAPRAPPLDTPLAARYATDAFVVAIVSFVISISLVKTFQKKHRYFIDVNQELLAYGVTHVISSFFNCFGGAGAPPRCATADSTGAKTTLHNLVSAVLLIITIYAIGPLFASLPNSALGALIIVAIWPLFFQVFDLPRLWKVNKLDGITWFVTFAAILVLDITLGLIVGLFFSVLTLLLQGLCPAGRELGCARSEKHLQTGLYLDSGRFLGTVRPPGLRIFSWPANLVFANVDRFKDELHRCVGAPAELKRSAGQSGVTKNEYELCEARAEDSCNEAGQEGAPPAAADTEEDLGVRAVIIDCTNINYLDFMGAQALVLACADYRLAGVRLSLAGCACAVQEKLAAAQSEKTRKERIVCYPTVADAVHLELVRRDGV